MDPESSVAESAFGVPYLAVRVHGADEPPVKSIVRRHMAAIIQNHIGRSRARSRRFVKRDVLLTADAYPDPRTMPCFATYLAETKANTEFAGDKRIIQRGTTTEVLDQISAVSPDFVYIDGDLTLHGISIDLIKVYPKVRAGGWIGGDDFAHTVWQHQARYEPTLVFPFASTSPRRWVLASSACRTSNSSSASQRKQEPASSSSTSPRATLTPLCRASSGSSASSNRWVTDTFSPKSWSRDRRTK